VLMMGIGSGINCQMMGVELQRGLITRGGCLSV